MNSEDWNVETLEVRLKAVLPPKSVSRDKYGTLRLKHPHTTQLLTLDVESFDSEESAVSHAQALLRTQYYNNRSLLTSEDSIEVLATQANSPWVDTLKLALSGKLGNGVKFTFSIASDIFASYIGQHNDAEQLTADGLHTLKISNLPLESQPEAQLARAPRYINAVIFELAQQGISNTRANIDLDHEEEEEETEADEGDTWSEEEDAPSNNRLTNIDIPSHYDPDLLWYYSRALRMEPSEFQYLAFFQIIECLFDEVHLRDMVQAARSILLSPNFSAERFSDLSALVDIVGRHNQRRDERTKTQLVLERYLKSDVPRDAFLISYKTAIRRARSLGVIQKDDEIFNMQLLARVLYDFRCECAHANRESASKLSAFGREKLKAYISLVRQFTESVIRNYRSPAIR